MTQTTKEFLAQISEEATKRGLNFFFTVAENRTDNAVYSTNNISDNTDIDLMQKEWERLHKPFRVTVLEDLYEYIQVAEREDDGIHFPFENCKDVAFHIYNGRKQVNICVNDRDGYLTSICNIIFTEDDVLVVSVIDGIANYDSPERYIKESSIAAAITNQKARSLILDALGPFCANK